MTNELDEARCPLCFEPLGEDYAAWSEGSMHCCSSCGWVCLLPADKARRMQRQIMLDAETRHDYYKERKVSDLRISRLYTWLASALSGSVNCRKLFDVGCGTGDLMTAFQYKGWNVWGCDISGERIEYCKRERKLEYIVKADILDNPFPSEQFDVITMIDLLAHLHDPRLTLSESCRRLEANGLLFIQTGVYCKQPPDSVDMDAPNHLHAYKLETLQRLLRLSGFTIIRMERFLDSGSLKRRIGLGLLLRAPKMIHFIGRRLAGGLNQDANHQRVWLWCRPDVR